MPTPSSASATLAFSINVTDPRKAITFYREAFGAEIVKEVMSDDGMLIHAEMKIGSSLFLLSSEVPDMGALSANTVGASPTLQCIFTDNADAFYESAVAAGAEVLMPLDNYFWSERGATLRDPFGYRWGLAQKIEDVEPEEMKRRTKEYLAQQAGQQ